MGGDDYEEWLLCIMKDGVSVGIPFKNPFDIGNKSHIIPTIAHI